jgi:hypothetical protein
MNNTKQSKIKRNCQHLLAPWLTIQMDVSLQKKKKDYSFSIISSAFVIF